MAQLPEDDFRSRRDFMPDEDFALVDEGPDPPLDVMSAEAWQSVMALPDDVVLRTTSFQGTFAEHCDDVWRAVIEALPQGRAQQSPVFEALLDLADSLQAASFSAIHGFYRQAFATLRSALELMIVTTRFALYGGVDQLRAWRYDQAFVARIHPVQDLDRIAGHAKIRQLNEAMVSRSLASGTGHERHGWIWDTFQLLSKFAHVTPGYTDGELWKSNGPVWVPTAFVLYIASIREVLAICAILARVADADLELGANLIDLITLEGEGWTGDVRSCLKFLGVKRTEALRSPTRDARYQ